MVYYVSGATSASYPFQGGQVLCLNGVRIVDPCDIDREHHETFESEEIEIKCDFYDFTFKPARMTAEVNGEGAFTMNLEL